MTNNESREPFEKWCATKKVPTERTPDNYYSYDVENAFIGWQARQPEIDALVSELAEANRKLSSISEANDCMKARIAELEALTQWQPIDAGSNQRGHQLVRIVGWREHSGIQWAREVAGDARCGVGQQGFNQGDIDRLLRIGDMDGGKVTHTLHLPKTPTAQE